MSAQKRCPVSVETSGADGVFSPFCVRRKAASQTDKPADKKEDESQTVSVPTPGLPSFPCHVGTPGPTVPRVGQSRHGSFTGRL